MTWPRIAGLALLTVGVAGASAAADNPALADAAERRNAALVRSLLAVGATRREIARLIAAPKRRTAA